MSGTNTPRIEIEMGRKRYIYECSICGNDARYLQRTNHPVCNDCRKKLDNQKTKARRAAEVEEAYKKGREDAYTDVRENLARLVINEVIDYGTYETLLREVGIENNEFFNFEGARELADTTTDCEDCEKRIRTDAIDELVYFVATKLALTHMPVDERATFYAELDIKTKQMKGQSNG